jgi:hypothetical protein
MAFPSQMSYSMHERHYVHTPDLPHTWNGHVYKY